MVISRPEVVALDGLRVNLRKLGDGPPVLLLHGFLGSALSWEKQLTPLAQAGYQAIALDLPGFGETEQAWAASHSHSLYEQVCASFVNKMGHGPVHVVGHSMGGQVGLRLTSRHSELVKTLTVIDGAVYRTPLRSLSRVPGMIPLLRRLIHRRWSDAQRLRKDLNVIAGAELEEDVHAYYWGLYQRPQCRDSVIAHIRDGCAPLSKKHLASIDVPVHIIWGERDPVFAADHANRLARDLTSAKDRVRVTVIPSEGHIPNTTAPEAVNAAILSFLTSHS